MKNILVIILVALSFSAYAQTEGLKKETINGKEYYLYPVEQGNTLYSISKKFNVSLQDISNANPEVEKGLSVGQIVKIPITDAPKQETTTELPSDDYVIHTSQQGETMYSISHLYGIPVKDLITHNPDYEKYLPLNANVKIPKKLISEKPSDEVTPIEKIPEHPIASPNDSLIIHKVAKGETIYAITKQYGISEETLKKHNDLSNGLKKGQQLTIAIPRKKPVAVAEEQVPESAEEFSTSEPIKGAINIAVFAPFMFDDYKREKAKCPTADCEMYPPTERALNYMHGVEMAIDSLKKLGVSTNVFVYDTKRDSVTVNKILQKLEFLDMDIIYAPFFEHEIAPVLRYAKGKKVLVVNVVPQRDEILGGNQNIVNSLPTSETQVEYLGTYLVNNYPEANIIAMRNNQNRVDVALYNTFQNAYKKALKQNNIAKDSALKATMLTNLNDLTAKFVKDKHNIVVVPSKDLRYVSDFMTKMNGVDNSRTYNDYKITVVGLEDWLSFNNIDLNYLIKFNTMFSTSSYVDYNSNDVKRFQLKYREEYNYDPNRYSFAAFETVLYHTYVFAISGRSYVQAYPKMKHSGMHINFDFQRKHFNSGFVNKAVTIVGFDDDGKLVKKN